MTEKTVGMRRDESGKYIITIDKADTGKAFDDPLEAAECIEELIREEK